ncbi:hypothetical protein FGO68_gene2805 [Halteria grandinella]|uniref:Uncharacterized protein n=1 Tax=Halteria grandinella TaxID=5974 RepID=A0A8J8NKN2_HALGN|nr:hypothetical protein FGO68_gene2805 [Halteria grandinella]
MRSILLSTAAVLFTTVSATNPFLLATPPQSLLLQDEGDLNLPFSADLACGACVRSGFSYCAIKEGDWYKRAAKDVCCEDDKCVVDMLAKKGKDEMDCATTREFFNETDIYYADRFNLLQKFCAKRQNSTACCNAKNPKDKCELKLRYKEWDNVTIDLQSVAFGGTCTYKVEAKCGYPSLVVNNSNIDKDDDDKKNETFHHDEANVGRHKDGKTEFKLDKKEKEDKDDEKEDCQKTKLYLTLTNLNNPNKAVESRMLQADGDSSTALLSYASDIPDFGVNARSVSYLISALFVAITYFAL